MVTPLIEGQASLEPELLLKRASPAMLDKALATVKPLPAYLAEVIEGAVRRDSLPDISIQRVYMEELHARGAAIWSSLAEQFRDQGEALITQAKSLPADSSEQLDVQVEAFKALSLASRVPDEAPLSLGSEASLFLSMQQ